MFGWRLARGGTLLAVLVAVINDRKRRHVADWVLREDSFIPPSSGEKNDSKFDLFSYKKLV